MSTINKFALVSIASKPLRTVLRWQVYVAAALTLAAGWWAGMPGAISALLGGWINISAGWVYAIMVSGGTTKSAEQTLRMLVRAEASKIALIALQLWLVLTAYHDVVVTAFFSAFVISVLVFPMALLVRD